MKLLPCPFCGNPNPKLVYCFGYSIECDRCDASSAAFNQSELKISRDEATEKASASWNRRAFSDGGLSTRFLEAAADLSDMAEEIRAIGRVALAAQEDKS